MRLDIPAGSPAIVTPTPTVTPIPSQNPAIPVCSSDSHCLNGGKCKVGIGCMCASGFVGPFCSSSATGDNIVVLKSESASTNGAPALAVSFAIDLNDPQLVHFRLDSTIANWISLMILNDQADLMQGDSATVYQSRTSTGWVLEDQFGHPFHSNMSDARVGGMQNLFNGVVWQPTSSSLSASWSRFLNTDDVADQVMRIGTFVFVISLQ